MPKTQKKFSRFAGSVDQLRSHALRMKIYYLNELHKDPRGKALENVCFQRKFWSEVFDRMNELKRSS